MNGYIMLPENWSSLTPDEKFDTRFKNWLSTENKQFTSEKAEKAFSERALRYYQIIKLQQPDRVPCLLNTGSFVAKHADARAGDFFYDYERTSAAFKKYYEDFDLDYQVTGNFFPGPALDALGYNLYSWPGGNLAIDRQFQYNEKEYMKADEYDALIADPETFLLRTYMPRICGELQGLKLLPSFLGSTELPTLFFTLASLGAPPLKEALKALNNATAKTLEFMETAGKIHGSALGDMGLPGTIGGSTKAPFDYIGDTMRGTRGIMIDMYRQPEKVIEACNRLIPYAVSMAVNGVEASGTPLALLPLHKGADGFMSNKDFEKFYWPSLKAVLLGIIEQGIVPHLFVEGAYNQRLDIIADSGLPAGKTIWMFDRTDMAAAKEKIGKWACIGGNVPASLFKAGTPQQMEDVVKKLIDTAGPGGGYFLAPGSIIDDAETANIHAYLKTAREYGIYKR
jgi:uroporphyrinogen-III decarboxylase